MKKLLSVTLIFICIFCGCSVQPEEIKVNRCFTAKAEIKFQSTAFTADFTSNESGCSAVFSCPKEINGLKIGYNGTEYTYSLGETGFTSSAAKENEQFLKIFFEAIRDPYISIAEAENGYICTGTVSAGSYYLYINNARLNPVYFEVDDADLSINFICA